MKKVIRGEGSRKKMESTMRYLEPKSEESLIQEDMEDSQGIYFVAMSLSLIKYPFSLHQRQRTCLAELCWVAGHFWLRVANLKLRSMKRNAGHGRGMLATGTMLGTQAF